MDTAVYLDTKTHRLTTPADLAIAMNARPAVTPEVDLAVARLVAAGEWELLPLSEAA